MSTEAGEILDATQATATADPAPIQGGEAKPEPKTEDPKLASRLEIIMRREQGVLQKEKSLKEYEASIEEERELIRKFREAKKGNSKVALELLGLDYSQLSESILKDGEIPPEVHIKKLEDKIGEQEKRWEEEGKRREQEALQAKQEQESKAVSDYKSEIGTFIGNEENKTRYELTRFEYGDEAQDIIYDVVDEHWKRTLNPETGNGKILSLKEAADKVEEFLEKKYVKAKEAEKIKALWGVLPKQAQETLAKQIQNQKVQQQAPKTLTNNMAPAPQVKTPRPPEDQRIRQIVEKFRAEKGI